MRIIVYGYIVRGPLGGLAWHHLQYVMGLARLGHDVLFLEDSNDYPSCYDPQHETLGTDPSYGLRFASRTFRQAGLAERWAYYDAHTSSWLGPAAGIAETMASTADALINLAGYTPLRRRFERVPLRILVDTDPVFTQISHLSQPEALARAQEHTSFFTFASNWPRTSPEMPDDGLPWQPTRQPIVLDAWTVTPGHPRGPFTTVMNWESYPPREYAGRLYGTKEQSFAPYHRLPTETDEKFVLAIARRRAPVAELRRYGWHTEDAADVASTTASYRRFIRHSAAEFTVAKDAYVVTRSGWFSERSAAYLASGRPVVTQQTGFSDWLETGKGVLAFSSPDEARDAVIEVRRNYAIHCRAARQIAERFFDSRKVLVELLEAATHAEAKRFRTAKRSRASIVRTDLTIHDGQ